MKKYKVHAFVFTAVLAAAVALASFVAEPGHGQSQAAAGQSAATSLEKSPAGAAAERALQPTAAVRERRTETEASASAAAFASAATRNAQLRYELDWTFGGKQQRGWHLYVPLITRLIETEQPDAAAHDFAASLARWQKGAGLRPSGILDDETLYRMVSAWQSVRLKDRSYPLAEQLLTVSAAEFYDPARPAELRQVEREPYAAYRRMVAAAAADPSLGLKLGSDGSLAPEEKFLKIISSFRSREYQEKLRRESPHSGRAGLATHSPHFTGRALDIYVGGEPVETKDSNRALQVRTPVYQWLVRNADRFGFRPYYYEPWHWEYVGDLTAEKVKVAGGTQ
jgi:D-alanyl-D-alanine carboxypeptidase